VKKASKKGKKGVKNNSESRPHGISPIGVSGFYQARRNHSTMKKRDGHRSDIDFKIMFLDCVIGRCGIAIRLPPYSFAKSIILKSKSITLFQGKEEENMLDLRHSEVVVIGGGIIGLACAYYLNRAGREVCLIEKATVGGDAGASYGNRRE
jgi:hypothetical protein